MEENRQIRAFLTRTGIVSYEPLQRAFVQAMRKKRNLLEVLEEQGLLDADIRAHVEALLERAASVQGQETLREDRSPLEASLLDPLLGEQADPDDLPGVRSHSERYALLDLLGEGGMGTVYLVQDRDIGREVAMKVLQSRASDRRAVQRFIEEIRATGQLEHPNIVPVYDVGQTADARVYYTMRYVRGRSLAEVLTSRAGTGAAAGEFSRYRLLAILRQVALGLHFAHDRGFVHRDVKPANIMLGQYGEVFLMDWGVVKLASRTEPSTDGDPGQEPAEGPARDATGVGSVIGTPQFMAPEQASGEVDLIDRRADVYALGAILFQILTGRPPGHGQSGREILERARAGQRPELVPLARDGPIPPEIEELWRQATEPDLEKRLPSAGAFAEALAEVLEGAREQERRRRTAAEEISVSERCLERRSRLTDEIRAAEARHNELSQATPSFTSHAAKKSLYSARQALADLQQEDIDLFTTAVTHLSAALAVDPRNPEARRRLADLYWERFRAAEEDGNRREAAYHLGQLQRYDDGTYSLALRGDGTLAVTTTPEGAQLSIAPLHERDLVLVPTRRWFLGETPVPSRAIPMGRYLLRVVAQGMRTIDVPLLVGRCADCSVSIRLHSDTEIGEGMVLVPGGPFRAGGDRRAVGSPPASVVELQDYFISRYPVTFAEYIEFLNDRPEEDDESLVPRMPATNMPYLERGAGPRWTLEPGRRAGRVTLDPRLPVLGITALAAEAYAEWRSQRDGRTYRLPTVYEWEKAARGTDGRCFPWGDSFDESLANLHGSRAGGDAPVPVGTFATDRSPYGVFDMGGNVQCWTCERAPWLGPAARLVRGGRYNASATLARVATNEAASELEFNTVLSMRLVTGPGGNPPPVVPFRG